MGKRISFIVSDICSSAGSPAGSNSDFANADDDHHSAAGLVGASASTCPTDSISDLTHAGHGAPVSADSVHGFNFDSTSEAAGNIVSDPIAETVVKLELVPIHQLTNSRFDEIHELLDEPEIIQVDEDCSMSFYQFAMPLNGTPDGLVKREDDSISGNISFTKTVSVLFV